jgi:hypothetical protein
MPASLHEMTEAFRELYEAISPYMDASKEAASDRGVAMRKVKEAGLEKDHFTLIMKNLNKEPLKAADWKRGLDAMWRDSGLPDPVTDDLLERNVRTARDAVTNGSNGEPDIEAEIPLPSATPPAEAYRGKREPDLKVIADQLESEAKAFTDEKAAKANAFRDRMAAGRAAKRTGAPN